MNKLQTIQFNMLRKLVHILEDNNIDYWLAYGSVLGSIRHGGFIPWDDDVDIYINGKDYKKLQKLFNNNVIDGLRLDDAMSCPNYPFTFPKIIEDDTLLIEKRFQNTDYKGGIYIDVFPLYNVSNYRFFRIFGYFFRYFNYAIVESHYADFSSLNLFRRMMAFLLCKFSLEKAQKRLILRYYKGFDCSKKYMSEPQQFNDKCLHFVEHFNDFSKSMFEELEVRIPYDYDAYLKGQYGQYMEFPPEKERVPQHGFVLVQFPDGTTLKGNHNE